MHLRSERARATHAFEAEPVVIGAVLAHERELAWPSRAGREELDGQAERKVEGPERVARLGNKPDEMRECRLTLCGAGESIEPVERA
jgi:hypothetical protein